MVSIPEPLHFPFLPAKSPEKPYERSAAWYDIESRPRPPSTAPEYSYRTVRVIKGMELPHSPKRELEQVSDRSRLESPKADSKLLELDRIN
jgi:hypothetical protein